MPFTFHQYFFAPHQVNYAIQKYFDRQEIAVITFVSVIQQHSNLIATDQIKIIQKNPLKIFSE